MSRYTTTASKNSNCFFIQCPTKPNRIYQVEIRFFNIIISAPFLWGCATLLMQRWVNFAGLRWLSLERPAYKIGPWLVSGNLDLRRIHTISFMTSMSHCIYKLSVQTSVVYAKHLLFFWESAILIHVGQKVPMWPAFNKTLGTESLFHFLCRKYFTHIVIIWY